MRTVLIFVRLTQNRLSVFASLEPRLHATGYAVFISTSMMSGVRVVRARAACLVASRARLVEPHAV